MSTSYPWATKLDFRIDMAGEGILVMAGGNQLSKIFINNFVDKSINFICPFHPLAISHLSDKNKLIKLLAFYNANTITIAI
jgi:hypothetical protein